MLSFIQRHARKVIGVLSGFDRLRLRGTLRWFANVRGLKNFLWVKQVRLTEFKDYAREVTTEVRQAAEELAAQAGQKVHDLSSSAIRKEQYAREVARQAGVTEGLLAVLSCVEPCRTYKVGRNAQAKRLELRNVRGKCLHYDFYYQDPVLGFLHLRLKHRLNHNSIKMYDKQGSVLRVETTINDVRDMKVYRPKEGDPGGDLDWRKLRQGVSDLHRRCQVSQAANERYLESLAAVDETTPLGELASPLCRPVQWQGRRVRGLNPFAADDLRLLEAVHRGEFATGGFRNKDLRPLLLGTAQVPTAEVRRQSAKITRLLRLLRAHGLIHKVPKTHRYVLSPAGRLKITTLLTARSADTAKLNELAI